MEKSKPTSLSPAAKTGIASLLAMGATQAAHAQIVMSTTLPNGGRPPASGSVFWDVDNDGTNDFQWRNGDSYAYFSDQNGGRIFGAAGDLERPFLQLNFGQEIGPSVTGFGFAVASQAQVAVTYSNGIGSDVAGWSSVPETGSIGFRFTSGADTHYGWASVTIDGSGDGQGFIVNEAWYNATAGASITAGAVPEPAAAATGLGLLALGAAGLRRQRWLKRDNA